MAGISLSLSGDKELIRMLDRLPKQIRRKVVPSAATKAMTPVSTTAKRLVRSQTRGTGLLAKSIGKRRKVYASSGTTVVVVGPRIGFKRKVGEKRSSAKQTSRTGSNTQDVFRNPSKYAHLVEFGHQTSGGGFVAPKPFLRPALSKNIVKIKSIMKTQIMKGIEKEAKKGRKR